MEGKLFERLVFTKSGFWHPNHILALNSLYDNIYELYHTDSTLQYLVYRNYPTYIALYANGVPFGSASWEYDSNVNMGGIIHAFEVSASSNTRYHNGYPLEFVTGVGIYQKGQDYYYNTVMVRMVNVNYFYYNSYISNGTGVVDTDSINTGDYGNENQQPPMYFVFDIATGDCIAFKADFHDEFYPLPNGSTSAFTPYA
jgi:hypothetical protein